MIAWGAFCIYSDYLCLLTKFVLLSETHESEEK